MAIYKQTFTADGSGANISFAPSLDAKITLNGVSLKKVTTPEVVTNFSIKEFLTGNTDEGREIFFRADTQAIHLLPQFEIFSNPLSIVTKLQRGSLVKCFVALEDDNFYELQGTVTKGTSIVKIHSLENKNTSVAPIARQMRISWRDGSNQLCRLTQADIIFTPGTMDYSE
jgi:hypothetical protein